MWGKYPGLGFPSDLPRVLESSANPKAALQKLLAEHIFIVMEHYMKRISDWDVINEPFKPNSPLLFDREMCAKPAYFEVLKALSAQYNCPLSA